MSIVAVTCFVIVILITLIITFFAARQTQSAADFYVAGGRIGGTQNGLAIAGDFMSAATLLGTTAMIFTSGYDTAIYVSSAPIAFTIFLFLMTDKLRELGHFTFVDILVIKLDERPIRIVAAITALVSALMYLMVQIVGAGALIQILFNIDYTFAVILVSVLMVTYVSLGGMLATTWVQITKAILLLGGITMLAILTMAHFGFDFEALYSSARSKNELAGATLDRLVIPGGLGLDTLASLSLGFGLVFGLVGSPHLLMRFFTVPDARAARTSAAVAMTAVVYVNLIIYFIVGVAAISLLLKLEPEFLDATGQIAGGTNMVAVHVARVVGGDVFYGIMAAVAFATILAVVAGLTLASASAVSHDLYASVIKKGQATEQDELRVSRLTAIVLGVVVIFLGLAFEGQNVAYLVSLALAVAASTNFPLLILSMYWSGFTTKGAVIGGIVGLVTTLVLMVLGPAVWVGVLGNAEPIFPSGYPALYAMVAAFATMIGVSLLDRQVATAR